MITLCTYCDRQIDFFVGGKWFHVEDMDTYCGIGFPATPWGDLDALREKLSNTDKAE